jgi:uncharacterized lipoprotein YehR (DUF1307 family)
MKRFTYIAAIVTLAVVVVFAGCGKSEKAKYMDVMQKSLELFKSDAFINMDMTAQQAKMKEVFDNSGLDLGKTIEDQQKALDALDKKYKDDPDVKKLKGELEAAAEEAGKKMMEKMMQQQGNPPAEAQPPAPEEPKPANK